VKKIVNVICLLADMLPGVTLVLVGLAAVDYGAYGMLWLR
jgi:hypothetical protein